jgi:hypothetical protein
MGFLLLSLFVGCGPVAGARSSVVTRDNYLKVEMGMSPQEVEAILGQGTTLKGADEVQLSNVEDMKKFMRADLASGKYVKWGDDTKFILVVFVGDKLVLKHAQGL